jgi:hypothetical protein
MTDSSDTSASVDGFQSGRPGVLLRTALTPVAKSGLAPFFVENQQLFVNESLLG